MGKLILSLLKLIPLKTAIEIILKYLTEQAEKTNAKWDDDVMKVAWQVYYLLKGQIPDYIKSAMLKANKTIT